MKNQRFENEDGTRAFTASETDAGGGVARAEAWLKRGQLCEAAGTPEGRREAVECQDAALAAAAGAAGGGGVGLVARIWMNRGNALAGLGEAAAAREAVRSYDRALALLGGAGGAEVEAAERGMMVGAAWLNRAGVLLTAEGGAGRAEAGSALERAIAELTPLAVAHAPARRNLAGAWSNRANWLREGGDVEGARGAWRRVVEIASGGTGRDAGLLELVLRARHALCVAVGERLASGAVEVARDEAEALAQVEAGLAEFAAWRGATPGSGATAARLFEFGAWFYRTRRARGLAGFLAAHADAADARRVEIARGAIHLARQEILGMDFSDLLAEAGEERRAWLVALGAVEARLAERGTPVQ